LLVPLALGLRRRILVRMAWRNAQRRPRQSLMIAAGLMVGTAIVAGAQVSGDSMGYGITKATLDAFQLIDETVYLDGYNFFPERVVDALEEDAALRAATDGIGSNIIWDGAVTNPRTGLYEPSVRWVGFDPEADTVWGPFRDGGDRFDGRDLGRDDIVLNRDLAEKLDARVGDRLQINYTLPEDPLVPRIQNFSGTLEASVSGIGPIALPGPVTPVSKEFSFDVAPSATRFNVILFWRVAPPATQDLDIRVIEPGGRVVAQDLGGDTNAPDLPATAFVNQSVGTPLKPGTWRVNVTGKAAANTAFNGTAITFYAVYNLTEFEQRLGDLQRQFPGFDPTDIAPPARETHFFRVAALYDEGKGPNFQLPNRLTSFTRLDTQQALLHREGEVNFLKVSNPGGVEDGAEETADVYPVLWERLNATKLLFPEDASVQNLRANNDKQFWLAEAERIGELFGVFLTFVGSFSIIAGLLLIINIFTMLAEERKVELAMARAVGLSRGHLVRLFLFEGVYYALPAALLGTFFGLGLAAALVWGFNAFNYSGTFPPVPFRLEPESLFFAFSVGILLTVATVYLGARRVSRLNIVSAIRSLEEPPHLRGRATVLGAALLLAIGVTGSWFAVAENSFSWQLLGPTFLAIGLAVVLRRYARKERVFPFVAFLLFVYLTGTLFLIDDPDTREADVFGPIRAVIMTLCVVVMIVYVERFARALGALFAKIPALRPISVPAVSYPLHKKFRTGMTLAMFSVILLVVMLFAIFGALFAPDVEKEAGGYHVEARSFLEFDTLEGHGSDPTLLSNFERVDIIPYFVRFGADIVTVNNQSTGQFGPPQNLLFGIESGFARANHFTLLQRESRYASDADAYDAVAHSTDLVIVSYPYSTDAEGRDGAHKVGEYLQLNTKGDVKQFRIVGIQEQFHFQGIWLARPVVENLFPNTERLVLFQLKDPSQDDELAKRVEANYKDLGLDANAIRTVVLEENESFRQIFTLIRLFLSLGLIVGILSLGIVTARSVIERRQEIGMMRALGYQRRHIRRTFLMEMLTTVAAGISIGTFVALIVSFAIWYGQLRELRLPYVVPWGELAAIAFIAFTVTTLSTLSPILRAARTPPAEALRYIE
jgi:putative ABC transport system permease protein